MLVRLSVLAAIVSPFALPAVANAGGGHLIVPGETLSGIAAANGLSPAQLAAANGLSADVFVIAGRSLTIPAPGPAPVAATTGAATPAPLGGYRVRLGDSLSAIAAEHGVGLAQLAAVNGLNASGTLVAGTSLRLPAGVTSTQSPGSGTGTTVAGSPASTTGTASATTSTGGGHAVVPGDTLTGIAAANGITPAALAAANGLAPNAWVIAGTQLKVPAGAPATGTAATAATGVPATAGNASASGATATAATNVPATGAATGAPGRLTAAQIGSIAGANGAPASLATAIAWQESGFNNAMVSVANARGIMQVIPSTWSYIQNQLGTGRLDPNSPADNVRAGSVLLARLLRDTGGDPSTAVAAYYQGLGSVRRIGMLPETRRYVANVLALRSRFGG